MDEIKLSDIDIHDIGSSIQIAGTIWSGKGLTFVTLFPGKQEDFSKLKVLPMELPDWEIFLHQTDLLETEILTRDPATSHIVKAIIRKTERSIDSYLQWHIFRENNYSCAYCGRTGIPLTVDHVWLYEEMGPTIAINLVSACKSCNKDRGRMKYEEWLNSEVYKKKSVNLSAEQKQKNLDKVKDLPIIATQLVSHIRSR